MTFVRNVNLRELSFAYIFDDSIGRVFRDSQGSYFELLIPTWLISIGKVIRQFLGMLSFYFFSFFRRFGLMKVLLFSSYGEIVMRLIGFALNNVIAPFLMFSSTIFMGTKETAQRTLLQHQFPNKNRATAHSIVSIFRSLMTAFLFFVMGVIVDNTSIFFALIFLVVLQIISTLNYYRIKRAQ